MKNLIWNCKSVAWKHHGEIARQERNCLMLYVCCEEGDGKKEVKETIRRVIQLNNKRYLKKKIIVMPFAHLSNEILEKQKAHRLISDLSVRLSSSLCVKTLDFDKDKELTVSLLPTNKDVSYFAY